MKEKKFTNRNCSQFDVMANQKIVYILRSSHFHLSAIDWRMISFDEYSCELFETIGNDVHAISILQNHNVFIIRHSHHSILDVVWQFFVALFSFLLFSCNFINTVDRFQYCHLQMFHNIDVGITIFKIIYRCYSIQSTRNNKSIKMLFFSF